MPQPKTFGEALHQSTLTVLFQQGFCNSSEMFCSGVFGTVCSWRIPSNFQTQLRCIRHHYPCGELSTCDHLTFQPELCILRNDHKLLFYSSGCKPTHIYLVLSSINVRKYSALCNDGDLFFCIHHCVLNQVVLLHGSIGIEMASVMFPSNTRLRFL